MVLWQRALVACLVLELSACSAEEKNPCGVCDDAVDCTRDVCNLVTRQCEYLPDDSRCSPGRWCDAVQGCVESPECQQPGDCDDSNPCTDEACTDGRCRRQNNQAACDDGDACTTGDHCAEGRCLSGPDTCQCRQDADCAPYEDGDRCNGTLVCREGSCGIDPDTVVVCQDDNPCTDDICQPADGQCRFVANQADCDDADACTGADCCREGVCRGTVELCCTDGEDNDGDGRNDCLDQDCAGSPACACPSVEAPQEPPFEPLPGMQPAGRCESTWRNGFQDEYLYDGNNYIKVGIRRDWGGSIIFYGLVGTSGPGVNGNNAIDANDTGREVQVAFYDPDRHMQNCAWDASCQSRPSDCPLSITYLGWDPVQGGNRCNVGSGLAGFACADGVMTATVDPLFWNPAWDRPDCFSDVCSDPQWRARRSDVRVVQRLRFIKTHVLQLDYTVTNLADLDHRPTGQEMPTVYAANGLAGTADLWRAFNSEKQEIAIDQPGNDGFFYKNFQSLGGWAAMQNDVLTYGVGLYAENRLTAFQAWQNRSLPFNNFRPLQTFGLPPRAQVRARAYLILGALDTIAAEAAWLDSHLPPFGVLDSPLAEAELQGQVPIWGWALDNKGVTTVELVIDGGPAIPLAYGSARPDVCLVWPGYAGCSQVGFQGTLDTSSLSACPHLIEIRARDGDGNQSVLARRRVWVRH